MYSSKSALLIYMVTAGLVFSAESFLGIVHGKAHLGVSVKDVQCAHVSIPSMRRIENRPGRSMQMAKDGGKKRRRRKEDKTADTPPPMGFSEEEPQASSAEAESTPPARGQAAGSGVATSGLLDEVLEGEKPVESLFTDDWSEMPSNAGMERSNVLLPDISTYKPKSKSVSGDYSQREKKTAVGLTVGGKPVLQRGAMIDRDKDTGVPENFATYKSKLPELKNEERGDDKFKEGPVVNALKTGTWFGVVALVAWEVYINSPLFARAPPPIT